MRELMTDGQIEKRSRRRARAKAQDEMAATAKTDRASNAKKLLLQLQDRYPGTINLDQLKQELPNSPSLRLLELAEKKVERLRQDAENKVSVFGEDGSGRAVDSMMRTLDFRKQL